jgi:undecaprenyl-diphosphatase
LTEFLPISSSGHLVLTQHLLGYAGSHLAFDLLVHLGTLLAVVIYFRRDIAQIFSSAIAGSGEVDGRRWIAMIALGTVPTAVIGYAFRDQFEAFFGQPRLVSLMLWLTAILLFFSDRIRLKAQSGQRLTIPRALLVGTAQGLAIIPGISRSGSTIATGIFSGLNPDKAARFSFLLSVPAIFGASLLEFNHISGLTSQNLLPYLAGTAIAFLSGYLAIDVLLKMVVKRRLWKFSIYLLVVGLIGLILT